MARKKKRRYRFRSYMHGKHYYWDVDGIYLDEEQTKGEGTMPTVSIDTSLEILDADASRVGGEPAVGRKVQRISTLYSITMLLNLYPTISASLDPKHTCLLYTSPSPRD